jgi:hypothetical protein
MSAPSVLIDVMRVQQQLRYPNLELGVAHAHQLSQDGLLLSPRLRTVLTSTLCYAAWLTLFYWSGTTRLAAFAKPPADLNSIGYLESMILQPVLFFAFGTLLIKREIPVLSIPQSLLVGFCGTAITVIAWLLVMLSLLFVPPAYFQQSAYWLTSLALVIPGLLAAQLLRFPRNRAERQTPFSVT